MLQFVYLNESGDFCRRRDEEKKATDLAEIERGSFLAKLDRKIWMGLKEAAPE